MRILGLCLLVLAGSVSCSVPDKFLSDAGGDGDVTLTITTSGDSSGTVTSSPGGIDCGSTCTMTVPSGTAITLTASPDADTSFDGWSGGGCGGTGDCELTLTADTTIDAAFNLERFALTVVKTGNGTGTVTSSPAGIDCGGDCTQEYDPGTVVTLTATPIGDSVFLGWNGGGCNGTGPCTVTVDGSVEVNAGFALNPYTLTVTPSGNGSGTVASSPAGIDCGLDCDELYDSGTAVTLTATPIEGRFSGWTGGGCAGVDPCTLQVIADTTVDASFTRITVTNVTSSTANGGYAAGAAISIQVVFSDPVTVTGTPALALNTGGSATYTSGSGTNTLTFTYTVAAGQNTADLDYAATSSLTLPGGATIMSGGTATLTLPTPGAAGSLGANKALVIDTAGPIVTSVNSTTANGAYTVGATISIQINFNEAATVTGTPALALNSSASATYVSGSGTTQLNFTYTTAAGQNTADLDYSATTSLTLPGGATIRDAVANNATLTLPTPGGAGSLGANKNIAIDTVTPTVTFSNVPAHSTRDHGTLMWTGSEPITITSCLLDAVAVTCASTATQYVFDRVSNATHTFTLNFRDAANNTNTANFTWLVRVPRYPNAMGGTYTTESMDKQVNALRACESHWGVGMCANDACGSCNNRGYHRAGTANCNGSTYWNYADTTQSMGCGWIDPQEILVSYDNITWQQGYTTGLGGTYTPLTTATKQANALRACEAVNGVGMCANDACGSCNNKGYHRAGTPNCNGSTYWNYNDLTQDMTCFWADPNEILVSFDGGLNWVQEPSNGFGGTYAGSTTNKQANALRACESVWGAGNCDNNACGICNTRGYHRSGAPNCNGSFYWNYADNDQVMSCSWADEYEIFIGPDSYAFHQAPFAMWDPTWSVAGVTYSNGYLSISGNSAGTKNVRTSFGKAQGKFYWEVTATGGAATTNHGGIGILESAMLNNASYIGASPSGLSFGYADAFYYYTWAALTTPSGTAGPAAAAITNGNVYMFALDMDAKTFWAGMNGTWFNAGNPGTGASPTAAVLSGTVFPGVTFYANSGNSFRANFGQQPFVYTVPTGFRRGFF